MTDFARFVLSSGRVQTICLICGDDNIEPDQGLGRARTAAWKTRHQHLEEK